jgi:hypothetical protein
LGDGIAAAKIEKHNARAINATGVMKRSIRLVSLLVFSCCSVLTINANVNVTEEHNNCARDGVYIDRGFTPANAAGLRRDLNFDGTIFGNVYAQPLYIEGGPDGPVIIAVTESNNVYALDATTGTVIWVRNLGRPVTSGLPCGNINPVGITSTPVVDLPSRRLFFDALIDDRTKQHFIYSLDVDTGVTLSLGQVGLHDAVDYSLDRCCLAAPHLRYKFSVCHETLPWLISFSLSRCMFALCPKVTNKQQ